MKLIETKTIIPIKKMKDGSIGMIISWTGTVQYAGRIVQRYDDTLISLGLPSGNSWNSIPQGDDCRVQILEAGTILEI